MNSNVTDDPPLKMPNKTRYLHLRMYLTLPSSLRVLLVYCFGKIRIRIQEQSALEQFSGECHKVTKTKLIPPANYKGQGQYREPIKTRSNDMLLTRNAGKRVLVFTSDWMKKKARVFFKSIVLLKLITTLN